MCGLRVQRIATFGEQMLQRSLLGPLILRLPMVIMLGAKRKGKKKENRRVNWSSLRGVREKLIRGFYRVVIYRQLVSKPLSTYSVGNFYDRGSAPKGLSAFALHSPGTRSVFLTFSLLLLPLRLAMSCIFVFHDSLSHKTCNLSSHRLTWAAILLSHLR